MSAASPRVLLLTPPYNPQRYRTAESLGIKYLGAVLLQGGIETLCLDSPVTGHTSEEILQAAAAFRPDFVGISVQFTDMLDNALELAGEVRAEMPGVHIGLGGYAPTAFRDRILAEYPVVDTITIGEGERTLPELLTCLRQPEDWHRIAGLAYRDGGTLRLSGRRDLITDLDSLPFPLRDDPAKFLGRGHYTVITSRGCPLECAFCSIPRLSGMGAGPLWRARSPSNVVDELQALAGQLGANTFSFADDNFLGSSPAGRSRAARFADEIIRRGLRFAMALECRASDIHPELFAALKAAGLQRVFMGVESGLDRVLELYQKHLTIRQVETAVAILRETGLEIYCHFIPYHPDATLDEIEQTFDFMDRLDLASPVGVANKLSPEFDTPVYHRLLKEGRLFSKGWGFDYYFSDWRVEALWVILSMAFEPLYEADYMLTRLGHTYREAQRLLSHKIISGCRDALSALRTRQTMTAAEARTLGLQMQEDVTGWLLNLVNHPV